MFSVQEFCTHHQRLPTMRACISTGSNCYSVRSEAKVVCKQLGYQVAQKDAYFTYGGDGGGLRILANNLDCAGAMLFLPQLPALDFLD